MAGLAAGLGHLVRRLQGRRFPGSSLRWTPPGRGLCAKPPEGRAQKPEPEAAGSSFRVPGHKPSDWDKRFLLWTGRFKKAEDIPETVSFEMIDAARNKMRVKISYLMIVLTILGCITMVVIGKRGVERHESLTSLNMAKKARWREEAAQSVSAKP